jgi:lactate permease
LSKSPVIAFAIASLVSWFYLTITKKEITESLKMASQKMLKVGIALFSMVALAQLFIYSGMNNIDFPSIPLYLAGQFSQLGKIWPIFAPIVGAFGAFVAGSATVSNLLFSSTHMEFGMMFGLSAALILALQTVGASLGNMVAIYNIVVASSVIKISEDQEGTIIKYNIVPLIIILVLVGLIGIIWQITS